MTYRARQRLEDIEAAIAAIRSHLRRGELSDGLVFDAVRIRLLEIGEAVKALPPALLASEPDIPWTQIARMRDHLAHRYFDTTHRCPGSHRGARPTRSRTSRPRLLRRLPDEPSNSS